MPDIINLLPDSVANQIAAGEVVDRPASAIKELLENAIDAGATSIQLIVKDAGRTLFQVIDNGCGMSDCDARLCFERHATSKIHAADDLFAIHTMGFRGEALASIAAVAQVELRTRTHESELGTSVLIEGSAVKEQNPCNTPVGTSLAVKNLFFNIPARRNFLKKDTIELSHIDEIFRRIALVNPSVAFTFHSNGKLLYDLHAGNFAQRIASIFGNSYKERLYPVDEHTELVSIHGYVCRPEQVRRTRGEQYLFVNGRFIKHPAINAAIEKAYTDLIPEKTYPSYFLCLKVDPARIDINIHPAKTEVRFEDEHALFAIIRTAVKKSLGQFELEPTIDFEPDPLIDNIPPASGRSFDIPQVSYDPTYNPFQSTLPKDKRDSQPSANGSCHTRNLWESFYDERPRNDSSFVDIRAEREAPENRVDGNELFADFSHTDDSQNLSLGPQAIQFQNRYIVSSVKSGLLIIDQQRAHERIVYERLMARLEGKNNIGSQQLLFPIHCTFCPADSELFNELMPDLVRTGFEITPAGAHNFVITATPTDVSDNNLQEFFELLISTYKGEMLQKYTDREKAVCVAMSRQMAVRQGQPLHVEEMQNIIAELFSCQVPNISPMGKKTMIIINDLDLRFK